MSATLGPASEYLKELCRQFPNAGTRTIARKAYEKFPECWSSYESCRMAIRYHRGQMGVKCRKEAADKSLFRKGKPCVSFDSLPATLTTVEQWKPVVIDGPAKVAVLSDMHIPYHDPVAVRVALEYCLKRKADLVLLNGDVLDFFSVSFWESDPRNRKFAAEIQAGREFLKILRDEFPKARIVYKAGNHEERFVRYMRVKAPELLDIDVFQFESVFGLDKLRIEYVKDNSPIKIGSLHFLHGHEYRFAISNPVNPARGLFLRAKVNCVVGHFHQASHHPGKRLDDHIISCWSTGCLCDLHPQYRPYNEWSHGFAFVEVDKTGAFQVDNLRIIDGKPWH